MLFLLISLADDGYLIEATQIVEVLPVVKVRHLPQAPPGLAGVFDYHGQPIPVVDLALLAFGIHSREWMSTRIIVVKYFSDSNENVIGLLAEQATKMLSKNETDFLDSSVVIASAPYLGRTTTHAGRIVQRIDIQKFLSGRIRTLLSGDQIAVGQ